MPLEPFALANFFPGFKTANNKQRLNEPWVPDEIHTSFQASIGPNHPCHKSGYIYETIMGHLTEEVRRMRNYEVNTLAPAG